MIHMPSEKSSQHAKFVEAAKKLGTDDDPAAFDARLKKLLEARAPKSVQERKKRVKRTK